MRWYLNKDKTVVLTKTSPSRTRSVMSPAGLHLAAMGVSRVIIEAVQTARPYRRAPPILRANSPPGIWNTM